MRLNQKQTDCDVEKKGSKGNENLTLAQQMAKERLLNSEKVRSLNHSNILLFKNYLTVQYERSPMTVEDCPLSEKLFNIVWSAIV